MKIRKPLMQLNLPNKTSVFLLNAVSFTTSSYVTRSNWSNTKMQRFRKNINLQKEYFMYVNYNFTGKTKIIVKPCLKKYGSNLQYIAYM